MNKKSKAREFAVQALYQWIMTGDDAIDIEIQFVNDHDMSKTDVNYFKELLQKVILHHRSLKDLMVNYLSRSFDSVDPVEQAILLLSCYEMQYKPELPYRVIINEGIELGKTFGAEDGHKFINGIMDSVASSLREEEISLRRQLD
ncbi:MAG: transcription antitermination factor NusB [Pseudomonadota bacterium]